MPELTPLDDNRQEHFLNGEDLEPITRREHFYAGRESELPAGHQEPETREEWFIQKYRGGGGDVTVVPLSVTENGTYSEEGKAYSPVSVNVPLPQNAYLLKSVANLPQAIASFNDGEDMVMPSLKVAIEPQQDLHGYDSPWVGGAGKNKFAGSYYNNYMSENNGVFTNTESDNQSVFRFIVQAFNDSDLIASSLQEVISSTGRYYVSITIPSSVTSLKIKHNGSSKDIGINCQFTATGTFTISLNVTKTNPSTVGGLEFKDVQIESGSQMTSYAPYENICPISGWDEVDLTVADDVETPTVSNAYTIDLDGTRYGGEVDVVNGIVTPAPYYASYNGETLTGEWISDRDKYEVGATPTIGAQVVNIGASGTPVSILPTQVKSLLGSNNVWADTGDITDAEYFSKEV